MKSETRSKRKEMIQISVIVRSEKGHNKTRTGNEIKIKTLRIMQLIAVGKSEVISGRDVT